jgi:hypothetical protein
MGGRMNGVRDTNTMGGFSYSSRVTNYAGYDDRGMGGGGGGFDGPGSPMMTGGGRYDEGPMMGGMEYDQMFDHRQQQQQRRGGGGYERQRGMGRMGP